MVNGDGTSWSTYHWQDNWPKSTCMYPGTLFSKKLINAVFLMNIICVILILDGHQEVYSEIKLDSNWAEEFHEFGVERSADYIAFSVDSKVVLNSSSTTGPKPLLWNMPFYLILNTAVGGLFYFIYYIAL